MEYNQVKSIIEDDFSIPFSMKRYTPMTIRNMNIQCGFVRFKLGDNVVDITSTSSLRYTSDAIYSITIIKSMLFLTIIEQIANAI